MIVFVTGVTGSGKTTAAREIAQREGLEYVDYDKIYGYKDVTKSHCSAFLKRYVKDGCVVDAIPADPSLGTFNEWVSGKDAEIRCAVLPEQQWLQRTPVGGHKLTHIIWRQWWNQVLPLIDHPVSFFDSTDDALRPVSHAEAMRIVGLRGLIMERVGGAGKGYDSKYQDIPELGVTGYSGSAETWKRLRDLADWESSTVVDCGCFHGYMLFRMRDMGCKKALTGLDCCPPALVTSRALNVLRDDNVSFLHWNAGDPLPESDITICLNAIHHFPSDDAPDPTPFLDSITSPLVIFEADARFGPLFEERWSVEQFPSARPGRVIYRCQ